MPIYKFKCPVCRKTKKVDQKINDAHVEWCDKSGECGVEMDLQIGTTSFVTKGRGWFKSGGY